MSEFDLPTPEIIKRLTVDERLERVGTATGLTARQANAITQARLQFALSELAERNVDKVDQWLTEVGTRSPAEAIRLFLDLLEFRMPKMKAAQVVANLTPNGGDGRQMKDMSIEELQSIIAEQ